MKVATIIFLLYWGASLGLGLLFLIMAGLSLVGWK